MPSEIVWLPNAVSDVRRLREFIQSKTPSAAARAAKCIKEATKILADNPEVGRPVDNIFSFRDLIIPFGIGNYVLRYREDGIRVIIVKVKHSREDDFIDQ